MKNIRIVHGTLMYPLRSAAAPSSLKRGGISTPLR